MNSNIKQQNWICDNLEAERKQYLDHAHREKYIKLADLEEIHLSQIEPSGRH